MEKLSAYIGQYVFLHTKDGTKLLCQPISMHTTNNRDYLVDIIVPSGNYEQGKAIISEDEVGYILELPIEAQQGMELTLKSIPYLKNMHQEWINSDLPSRVQFGRIKKNDDK